MNANRLLSIVNRASGIASPAPRIGSGGRGVRSTLLATFALFSVAAQAQIPRINTFFPIGGKAGTTVDIEIRGSSLEGANALLAHGPGVQGKVQAGDAKADETNKPLWQAKCQGCHELRSPANRSLTPAQWAATVERMVKVRQAPLSADEAAKVSQYLVSAARAGRITAQVSIAPDTLPGIYELRVATARGVSSPAYFEVGNLPEVIGANSKREQAQPITLPCIANGCFQDNGEHHYYKFTAKKGQRLVFNMKGCRYNDLDQSFFNPNLRLYDATGKELVENHGYYDFDPLIDWTVPADGEYVIEARDLLGRGNPSSVYRLTMGPVSYDTVLYPPAATAGTKASLTVTGKDADGLPTYTLNAPTTSGLTQAPSPCGPNALYVSPYPVVRDDTAPQTPTALPAAFAGRIGKPGEADSFPVQGSGVFEFEAYASRLNAPTNVRIALLNAAGSAVASVGGDTRMTAKLEAGQKYTLKVDDASGQGGAERVYCVEARPARPGLECVARPDNVTLRRGLSAAVEVILTRREGTDGDITVTAEDLPPGVSAEPVVIQPDRGSAWLILTAAPDAKPSEKPFRIVATGRGPTGETKVAAVPQELYRLLNDLRARNWADDCVTVRGEPNFTAEFVTPAPIKVHPRKAFPVKVKIKRKPGFTGGVTVYLSGLPQGWVANPEGTNGDEVTLNVRPDGNDTRPFLNRDTKLTPIRAVLEAASDEFRFCFGTLLCQKADRISDRDDDR